MEIPALLEQLCLNISKSSNPTSDALALGRLVRWNKEHRRLVAQVGGLQALTSMLSTTSRTNNMNAVTAISNVLSWLALDTDNKLMMIDPSIQGGGCDVLSIARLCISQMATSNNQSGGDSSSKASKYVAPPTDAGCPTQVLCSLSRLVWNVSNTESEHEFRCAYNGDDSPSLVKLLSCEFLWLSDQLESIDGERSSKREEKEESSEWKDIRETRFQVLGALWSLSSKCIDVSNESALELFVPLLPTIVRVLEVVLQLTTTTTKKQKSSSSSSSSRGQHAMCMAAVGLLVNLLDHSVCVAALEVRVFIFGLLELFFGDLFFILFKIFFLIFVVVVVILTHCSLFHILWLVPGFKRFGRRAVSFVEEKQGGEDGERESFNVYCVVEVVSKKK